MDSKSNKQYRRARGPRPNKGTRGHYTGRGGSKNPPSTTGNNAIRDQMASVSNNTGMVLRYLPLFAQRTRRTLVYAPANLSTITGTATANAYVFSANGLFDPDVTGTGGQPMGFDQMMSFYNHYTVLRSKIRCNVTNTSTSLVLSVGCLKSGSSTVTTSIEQLLENGDVAYAIAGFYGAQGSTVRVTQSCDNALFQGIDNIMDDPNMRGDSASNPTEQTYFHVSTWNNFSAVQITSALQPIIEYDVVFHEPRKGPLS